MRPALCVCVTRRLQAVLGELLEQGLNEPKYTLKSLLVLNAAVQVSDCKASSTTVTRSVLGLE